MTQVNLNGIFSNAENKTKTEATKRSAFVLGKTYIATVTDIVADKTKKNEDKAVFTLSFDASENLPDIHMSMVDKFLRGWLITVIFSAANKVLDDKAKALFSSAEFADVFQFNAENFIGKQVRVKAQERDENDYIRFFLTAIVKETKE